MTYKLYRMRKARGENAPLPGDPEHRKKLLELIGGRTEKQKLFKDRGTKLTFISFAMIGAALVVMKGMNSDIRITKPLMMLALVFGGCFVMTLISRRKNR